MGNITEQNETDTNIYILQKFGPSRNGDPEKLSELCTVTQMVSLSAS
jgi:hypothetical protein